MKDSNVCAINPRVCKQFGMWVELFQDLDEEDRFVPWVRVFQTPDKDLDECAYVRLDQPQYFLKGLSAKMTFGQLERFIIWLNTPWIHRSTASSLDQHKTANNYQAAVDIWSETYEPFEVSRDDQGFIQVPDYHELPHVLFYDDDRSVGGMS